MAEVYEFPVEEAKARLVPTWQRSGLLRRLPNPYLNDDSLLVDALLHSPGIVKKLLRSRLGKERIRALVDTNSKLFDYMARFKRKILEEVGIMVTSAPIGIESLALENQEEDDFLEEHGDTLDHFNGEDCRDVIIGYLEYLRSYKEDIAAMGRK